jgi:hypothetical protein
MNHASQTYSCTDRQRWNGEPFVFDPAPCVIHIYRAQVWSHLTRSFGARAFTRGRAAELLCSSSGSAGGTRLNRSGGTNFVSIPPCVFLLPI